MHSRAWPRLVAFGLCFLLALTFAVPAEAAKPPVATAITVAPVSAQYADTVTLSAVLTSGKNAVAGRTITFTVNGGAVGSAVTDSTGRSSLLYTVPMPAGTYTVEALFAGDRTYQAVSGTAMLTVSRRPANLTVFNGSQTAGQPATLSAVVRSTGGDLALAGTVSLTVQRDGVTIGEYSAPVNGDGVATVVTEPLSAGQYSVTGTLASAYYAAQPASSTFMVNRLSSAITLPDTTGSYGEFVPLESVLTANGDPLPGKTVTYWVAAVSAGSAVTDAAGRSSFLYPVTLPAGAYVVNAVFSGDAVTWETQAQATLTVIPRPATLEYAGGTQTAGKPATLTATVTAYGGDLTQAGPVTFTLQQSGSTVGTYTAPVSAGGVASVSTEPLPAGDYSVTASIHSGYYAAAPATGTLSIVRPQTVLTLENATGQYSDMVQLTATLRTADGLPLAGKAVTFNVNGTSISSAVTDPSGVSVVLYSVLLPAGSYYVGAEFLGDWESEPAAGWADLTVVHEYAYLQYVGATQADGGPLQLDALVSEGIDGMPGDITMVGAVTFTVVRREDGAVTGIFTAPVRADGYASVMTMPMPAADYDVILSIRSNYYWAPDTVYSITAAPPAEPTNQ